MGSKKFGVDNDRELLMDIVLELSDASWKWAHEGVVDESKISKEIVADNGVGLSSKRVGDLGKLTRHFL